LARALAESVSHAQTPGAAETPQPLLVLAWVRLIQGQDSAALAIVARAEAAARASPDVEVQERVLADVPHVLMALGRTDAVLERLEQLVGRPGGPTRAQLRIDAQYLPLRGDPRFQRLLAEPR
jgi:hypothetical protein